MFNSGASHHLTSCPSSLHPGLRVWWLGRDFTWQWYNSSHITHWISKWRRLS
uniref:Uncharacterized protein n=1 Tax=Helianthus annuus TaxID=4232 RepID=A0A251SW54_HELAN